MAARPIATESYRSRAPSSIPGRRWQCRSITATGDVTVRRVGAGDHQRARGGAPPDHGRRALGARDGGAPARDRPRAVRRAQAAAAAVEATRPGLGAGGPRSEEHTSELQSLTNL